MKSVNICQENLAYSASKSIEGIYNINMDIVMSELVIIPSDGNDVVVEFYFDNPHHLSRFNVGVMNKGNTINIVMKKANILFEMFSFIAVTTRVFIPKSYGNNILINGVSVNVAVQEINANDLNVKLVSGRCMVNQVKSTNFDVNCVSGNIQLNEISSDSISIESKSGTVIAENMHLNHPEAQNTKLYINSVSGKVDAIMCDCFEIIKIKAISGSVTLSVPSDYQFKSNLNSVSGKVRTISGSRPKALVNNHKQNLVDINTISGSITINN